MRKRSPREQPDTLIRYFDPESARCETVRTPAGEYTGLLTLGEAPGASKDDYKRRRDRVVSQHRVTIRDAREWATGGLAAWQLEAHGFTFVGAPEPVADFHDRTGVRREYLPRVLALMKASTGASHAFLMGHQVRSEETGRGTSSSSYARFAHSDYGPDFEPLLRRLLVARHGFSEADALGCGMCCAGLWTPIERPAYKDPLCLLDCGSVDIENEMVRYIYQGDLKFESKRPFEERVPAAAQDAPAIAPIYSPHHRWFFVPDMRPEEAVIFKQYDWRPGVAARACWHDSFRDRFHDDWEECPGRRSIEFRILLTFPDDAAPEPRERSA